MTDNALLNPIKLGELALPNRICFVAGRIIHANGLTLDKLNIRVLGMKITFSILIILALTNITLFVYGLLASMGLSIFA